MAAAKRKQNVRPVVAWLRAHGTKATRDGMARYAIPSDKAFGVTVGAMRTYAKKLGRDHELANALWADGHYESRMLACFVDEAALVTPAQMERWCRDFDNWAICDTACFALFDRTPHAWKKVDAWAPRREEFVRRAAFALLASLSVHDKEAGDGGFVRGLRLIERAAPDERNFVKKAVNWALRSIGKRNTALNAASVKLAKRLSASAKPAARWVGKDALRELTSASVLRRLGTRGKKSRAARARKR
jgi:prepilin-type processing-associated H-X9-DG protein